jgi:hypothetical protein
LYFSFKDSQTGLAVGEFPKGAEVIAFKIGFLHIGLAVEGMAPKLAHDDRVGGAESKIFLFGDKDGT